MKKLALSEMLAAFVVAGLIGFLGLTLRAALVYPGGTYCEPAATSYRFWGNYFCDLTASVTGRGLDNSRSAALAHGAFASFGVAAGPFFWLLAELAGGRPLARALGLVSALATVGLAWIPSGFGPGLHALAVFCATIPGLAAAGLGVQGLRRSRPGDARTKLATWLGAATILAGFADAAGYGYALSTRAGCVPWLPALQKMVGLLLVAWMLAVAVAAVRQRPVA